MTNNNTIKHVVVVEDEDDLRETVAFQLEMRGLQVRSARDASEALKLLEERMPDVVLTDLKMPGMDGLGLLDAVRKNKGPSPAVILMTGMTEFELADGYNRGLDAIITKPFEGTVLEDAVIHCMLPIPERWSESNSNSQAPRARLTLNFPQSLNQLISENRFRIGRGGLALRMSKDFHLRTQTELDLSFRFESGTPNRLSLSGIVRWLRSSKSDPSTRLCGIEFTSLNSEMSELVQKLSQESGTSAFIPIL